MLKRTPTQEQKFKTSSINQIPSPYR